MQRILLTGMSGVGKSTLVRELAVRGYKAVDVGEPGWSAYGRPEPSAEAEWLWQEERVEQLLDTEDADALFVAGCASNQVRFYPRFDHIVLLTTTVPLTTERLATRTTNRFGQHPDELARVLADKATVEPLLRPRADLEIDTSAPLETVVERVLNLIRS